MTDLILIRHGQTPTNVAGRWEGWGDSSLTPRGEAQAAAVADRLAGEEEPIAALYTSPLRRAQQTAAAIGIALGLDPIPVDDLREINFGEADGTSVEEMETTRPALYARWKDRSDMMFQWPGGERRIDFYRRLARACDDILARHPQETVAVVTHGGALRACLAHLLSEQMSAWWRYALDNCGVSRVRVDGSQRELLTLNDVAHLPTQ